MSLDRFISFGFGLGHQTIIHTMNALNSLPFDERDYEWLIGWCVGSIISVRAKQLLLVKRSVFEQSSSS